MVSMAIVVEEIARVRQYQKIPSGTHEERCKYNSDILENKPNSAQCSFIWLTPVVRDVGQFLQLIVSKG
jgi:hypothetical protein